MIDLYPDEVVGQHLLGQARRLSNTMHQIVFDGHYIRIIVLVHQPL